MQMRVKGVCVLSLAARKASGKFCGSVGTTLHGTTVHDTLTLAVLAHSCDLLSSW